MWIAVVQVVPSQTRQTHLKDSFTEDSEMVIILELAADGDLSSLLSLFACMAFLSSFWDLTCTLPFGRKSCMRQAEAHRPDAARTPGAFLLVMPLLVSFRFGSC